MVLLTVTASSQDAIRKYCELTLKSADHEDGEDQDRPANLPELSPGDPIDHDDLIKISHFLVESERHDDDEAVAKEWRLERLLKGAAVYRPPPPPKPEPTPEYKALMKRLLHEEEERRYDLMVNPRPSIESYNPRFPGAGSSQLGPFGAEGEPDEVTYADVNRQMTLIINVLVSIICCSIAIWIAARRWDVPHRLGLSMSGSGLVAVAEVAIYMGYIKRVKEAKGKEVKKMETKKVMETWVLDGSMATSKAETSDGVRFRKGKHR